MNQEQCARIKAARKQHGFTLVEMARRCGLSNTGYVRIEIGGDCDAATRRRIERVLGITLY